jgi:hypothetical protein
VQVAGCDDLMIALQPRRFTTAPGAVGCKRLVASLLLSSYCGITRV